MGCSTSSVTGSVSLWLLSGLQVHEQQLRFLSSENTRSCGRGRQNVIVLSRFPPALTCFAFVFVGLVLFVPAAVDVPEFVLGVFIYQVGHQNGFQQTEQHQGKNHDTVGGCKEETGRRLYCGGVEARAGVRTYEGGPVGHGGQDVIQDEQQDRDGQQHGDLEAQFLSSVVSDEERGQVQSQEEHSGQQEVDDVEEGPPLHGDLRHREGLK